MHLMRNYQASADHLEPIIWTAGDSRHDVTRAFHE
jgi:hypothetical protein